MGKYATLPAYAKLIKGVETRNCALIEIHK